MAYCALGRPDDAVKWLNRAYERHEKGLGMIGIDPLFANCYSDPRYIDFLGRLRLVPNKLLHRN
jgi:hypothetical protein